VAGTTTGHTRVGRLAKAREPIATQLGWSASA
jgi:hypothetical protein